MVFAETHAFVIAENVTKIFAIEHHRVTPIRLGAGASSGVA